MNFLESDSRHGNLMVVNEHTIEHFLSLVDDRNLPLLKYILLIIDEVHNYPFDSKVYQSLIKMPCIVRLGVTGTPTQKYFDQIVDLYDLLLPPKNTHEASVSIFDRDRFLIETVENLLNGDKLTLQNLKVFFRNFMWRTEPAKHRKKIAIVIAVPFNPEELIAYTKLSLSTVRTGANTYTNDVIDVDIEVETIDTISHSADILPSATSANVPVNSKKEPTSALFSFQTSVNVAENKINVNILFEINISLTYFILTPYHFIYLFIYLFFEI